MVIDHFVVLGAGASFGARCPRPPLGDGLAGYLVSWLDANDHQALEPGQRFEADAHDCSTVPPRCSITDDAEARKRLRDFLVQSSGIDGARTKFETTLERVWEDRPNVPENRDLIRHVQQLIALALCTGKNCVFDEEVDLYDDLLKKVLVKRCAFVILNYDTLLEEALLRHPAQLKMAYAGLDAHWANADVPVIKLHGSINWFAQTGAGASAVFEVAQRNTVPLTDGPDLTFDTQRQYASAPGRYNTVCEMKLKDDQYLPLMGLFMKGKSSDMNVNALGHVRETCLGLIRDNPDAKSTIIGVRIPSADDDPYIHDCLRAFTQLRGGAEFVNPSSSDRAVAESLGLPTLPYRLEEWLKM